MDMGHVVLPSGRREYFLVAVDYFTKWVEVKAVAAETSLTDAKFIQVASRAAWLS